MSVKSILDPVVVTGRCGHVATWSRCFHEGVEQDALRRTFVLADREYPTEQVTVRRVATGTVGELEYRSRDIGYGVEEAAGEFVARGFDKTAFGKFRFDPVGGGPSIWLFEDEIVAWDV